MRWIPRSPILLVGAALACVCAAAGPAGGDVGEVSACQPLVVEAGGTYGGCYRSTDPEVPAVLVQTTEPVRLVGARIEHAGDGVVADVDRLQLTVVDSTITALDPQTAEPVSQRAITAWRPRRVVVEHNRFVDGHGISLVADGDTATNRLAIRFNESIDIGRYGHPTDGNCCIQFVQLDHLVVDGVIGWNHTVNHVGRSSIEDNLNLYGTEGRSADRPFVIHHNLIDGAYPETGAGRRFTGGGIMINDSGGAYVEAVHNRVVSTTNYALAIVGGHDSQIWRNTAVSDGRADDGSQLGPEYAVGLAVWDASETGDLHDVSADRNRVGWLRGTDLTRNDWWIPACDPSSACDHNRAMRGQITAADEQHQRELWWADVAVAGHTIGPR